MPSFLLRTALAQKNAGRGKDHPIIIVIFQRGAADGISMVVPFGDKNYYQLRPQIGIPEPGRNVEERAIDLDGFFGLHPALASLKPIYDENRLAIEKYGAAEVIAEMPRFDPLTPEALERWASTAFDRSGVLFVGALR